MWTRVFHRALLATLCLLISPHSAAVVDELRFESPVSGAVIEAGTLPVLGRLPMDYRFHTAELFVDGALVESTPVVVRRRWWEGKGVDLCLLVQHPVIHAESEVPAFFRDHHYR